MSATGRKNHESVEGVGNARVGSLSAWLRMTVLAVSVSLAQMLFAEVPAVIHYQGRVLAGGNAFAGTGQFKFSLVNADATLTYWRNSVDADANGEPDNAVSMPVTRGLYSVLLGDTTLANMAPLPSTLFTNPAVYLRVWFSDGVGAFEHFVPDQRIVAVGYAMVAGSVSDGAIGLQKLGSDARGAIESALGQSSNLVSRTDLLQSQIATLSNHLDNLPLYQLTIPRGMTAVSADPADSALIANGFAAFNTLPAPAWVNGTPVNSPSPRYDHSAVWTGDSFIVWGGNLGGDVLTASGSIYRPALDAWESLPTFNSPVPRNDHTAVWTGQNIIIWGGYNGQYLNSGAKIQPGSPDWNATTATGVPSGRIGHVAVWTGSRMVVWGGVNSTGLLNDGALYDPLTDAWTPLTLPNPPAARQNASFIWAGDRLILWGGSGASGSLNTGAQLLFSDNSHPSEWRTISTTSAPSARIAHSIVWTGQNAILWGGQSSGGFLGDGAAYNPALDTWQAVSSTQAPSARGSHGAVWTGSEMLIIGGDSASGALATCSAYSPADDRWRILTNAGSLQARKGPAAVWSGSELIVFGGRSGNQAVGALQRLNPQPAWTFFRKL